MAMGFVNALSPMNIVIMIASVTMGIVIGFAVMMLLDVMLG